MRVLVLVLFMFPLGLFAQVSDDPFFEYIYEKDSINNRILFLNPDKMPCFTDKNETFQNYFIKNFKYPSTDCIQTKIMISFVVESSGLISNKKIVNKLDCDLSKAIMTVLDSLPKMRPGIIKGKPVPVLLTYPITIELK